MTMITLSISLQPRQYGELVVPSPDGKWQAVVRQGHCVEIITSEGQRWATYYGHRDGVYARSGSIQSIAWSPGGDQIASASSTGSVHVWNRHGIHLETLRQPGESPVRMLSWDHDGLHLSMQETLEATSG